MVTTVDHSKLRSLGRRKNRILFCQAAFIVIWLFLISLKGWAQESVSGEVIAGEKGYELSIEVVNWKDEAIQSVAVKVVEQPQGLVNFKVSPPSVSTLPPGEIAVFQVRFDVSEDATPQDRAEIAFSISAANASFDNPQPRMVVAVIASGKGGAGKDGDSVLAGDCNTKDPVLHLVDVQWLPPKRTRDGETVQHSGNHPGYHGRHVTKNDDVSLSVGVTRFPSKILLGSPFEFEAETFISEHGQLARTCVYTSNATTYKGFTFKAPGANFRFSDDVADPKSFTRIGSNFIGEKRRFECPSPDWQGKYSNEQLVGMKVTATLVKVTENKNKDGTYLRNKYLYKLQSTVKGKGNISTKETLLSVIWREREEKSSDKGREIWSSGFGFALHTGPGGDYQPEVRLIYLPHTKEKPCLSQVPAYKHPKISVAGLGDQGEPSEEGASATSPPGKPETSKKAEGKTPSQPGDGEVAGKLTPGGGRPATPGGTAFINPADPNILALIREWIAKAEPPQNVTEGADFKFNPWGQLIGTAGTGVAFNRHGKPDNPTALTPEGHVWNRKDELDSVDHCTLGEYVEARLNHKNLEHCVGRYRPVVKDLSGLTVSQAKEILQRFRLKVQLRPGDNPPSEDLALKVQRQQPQPSAKVNRGETVKIWVHSEFVKKSPAPAHSVDVPAVAKGEITRTAEIGPGMQNEVNFPGTDLSNFWVDESDPAFCQKACEKNEHCKAWTYVKPKVLGKSGRCWLKHKVPNPKKDECCISGVRGDTKMAQPPPPEPPLQISPQVEKAMKQAKVLGSVSRPTAREKMNIRSGSGYTKHPDTIFVLLRGEKPRPDGLREYHLILGHPCDTCKNYDVLNRVLNFTRERFLGPKAWYKADKDNPYQPAMVGIVSDYCAYLKTFSQGIPFGHSGARSMCEWPKQ